ncbi:hypothetical protein GYMLUDRAFT_244947 [Collybiopsis luxurians FD-317 M1]|uniref:Uncharacterized protein n=1 Tax=Collybiopsis luxurians FD-317 M1 TaxID=944289 RepID=A0A0D0CUZ3_9AGAR|nr:hypothetical protein GYMLUDRAFT_244947 [Collybiopsis luxurians FD-317 M1]
MATNPDPSQSDQPGSSGQDTLSHSSNFSTSNEPSGDAYEPTLEIKSPLLPQISADTNLSLDLDSIISAGNPEMAEVNKRASNVQKLAEENEKLKAELREMSDRLEAAERRRQELNKKTQNLKEPPSE